MVYGCHCSECGSCNPLGYLMTSKTKSDGGSTSYYQLPPEAKELQDLIEHKNMNFAVANIFKACFRLGEKDGQDGLYDLNKIIWFTERERARLKKGCN